MTLRRLSEVLPRIQSSGSRGWLAAILIAVAATAMMQIPYALGYLTARPGTEYTGILLNVEDYAYYATMLQGSDGAWEYHIQFTTEPHEPAFLYGFYLALGHLARLLNCSIAAMWHAARIATSLMLFLAVYAFIGLFLRNATHRMFAYLLAVFGSGFDWTLFPLEHFDIVGGAPVDFRMPEAHLFYTALTYPHVSFGITLLLIAFWLWLGALDTGDWRRVTVLSAVNLAIGIVYPFLAYLVAAVLGAHWLVSSVRARRILCRQLAYLVAAGLLAAPLCAYYAYVLATNAVFRVWDAQSVTLSPNPVHYLLAYGVMLVLALPAFAMVWKPGEPTSPPAPPLKGRGADASSNALQTTTSDSGAHIPLPFREGGQGVRSDNLMFLWIWIIMAALLLYAPLNAQRRFLEGLQVPLAILATIGVFAVVAPRIERTRLFRGLAARPGYTTQNLRRLLGVSFLLAMSTANAIVLVRLSAFTAVDQLDALFRPRAEVQAVDWLRARTARSDAVLGDYWTGSFIPAQAGNAVFVGNRYETSRFADQIGLVSQFFNSATDDTWRASLLEEYHIAYVFVGPRERALGDFDPDRAPFLSLAYSIDGVRIYRVHFA